MKSTQNKLRRSHIFRHLDGIVMAPTAYALYKRGITKYLLLNKRVELDKIAQEFNANKGYLNVALRGLCSQGWLEQKVDNEINSVHYVLTEVSEFAFSLFHLYEDVVDLLQLSEKYHQRRFEIEPFLKLESIYKKYKVNYGVKLSENETHRNTQDQILKHIEGIIVGPTIVHLGITGMFHKYFMESRFKPEEFHKNYQEFDRLLHILAELGWFKIIKGSYEFTDYGLFFAKRASAYGVTVSYIPTP